MIDSATETATERRRRTTAGRITSVSRRLAAHHGLSGFTVEEVCDEVGISRRTFFNYFPSKEEAIVGIIEADEFARLAEQFLAQPSRGWAAVIDDLVDVIASQAAREDFDTQEHVDLLRAIEREPRLLARFMGISYERDQQVLELIAHREGVPTSDPHARAIVGVLGLAIRSAGERLSDPDVAADFIGTVRRSLDAMRVILTPDSGKASE